MTALEALVSTLEGLARQALSDAPTAHSDYAKGLFEGSALAYENAAKWLERELEAG
jgi:hypothetical protein